jgi:competence protein ComEC
VRGFSRVRLAALVVPFALGIFAEDRLGLAPAWPLACASIAAGLRLARRRLGLPHAGLPLEMLLGFGLGALALALRLHAPVAAASGEPVALELLGPPEPAANACRLLVFVQGDRPGRALVHAPPETCAWLPGQAGLARLRLRSPRPATNPGGGDRARRWARRGVRAVGVVEQALIEPVASAPRSARSVVERVRRRIALAVDDPERAARAGPLLRALLIGDRRRLDEDVRAAFQRSGTAHLLAVSGLHVGWVFLLTQYGVGGLLGVLPGLWLARRARRIALGAGVAAACAYAALAGLGPPSLRAAAMAFAGAVAVLGGRPGAAWNALALAALVVLALEPAALFGAGFWLSFLAVAGILVWAPAGAAAARLVGCTLGASLATAPLIAALGAPLPAFSLLANLVAVPWFAAVVVPLALVAGGLGAWLPAAHRLLEPLARASAELGIRIVESLGSADLIEDVAAPSQVALAAALFGFASRLLWRGRRAPAAALAAGSALVLALRCADAPPSAREDSVLFLDVGHGDAAVLRSEGRVWLVDAGSRFGAYDAGRLIVAPALRAEGLARLDALVITHADADHIGGAASVVESIPVGEIWLTHATYARAAAAPLRRSAALRGTPVRLVGAGARARVGGWRVTALWPPPDVTRSPGSSNAGSLVLRAEGRHGCAMLPGDVPAALEERLAQQAAPCELLKLSHHGSRTSTAAAWLGALEPWVAIASYGRLHAPLPHPSVTARLRGAHVSVYETARFGAVRVLFTRAGLVVAPYLANPLPDTSR